MDLFEYQAKQLFAAHGIPVPEGDVATTPGEARAVAERLLGVGGRGVVVKAQVKTGGRGKAGGIQLAETPNDAETKAAQILGMDIKGHAVRRVLVERAGDIAAEYYFSILLDRADRGYLAMCSAAGGMDIEEVAATTPEKLAKVPVSPLDGIDAALAADIVARGGIDPGAAELIAQLWDVFAKNDATLVEVNPLVRTGDGRVIALDGKVTLDDNALFRHPHLAELEDKAAADPLEQRAKEKDLNYVKLDGSVGIVGNGAGLVMSTLDVVAYAGEELGGVRPANFLDIGGGASADVMASGLDIVLTDPSVRSVFVNIFGGITQCDLVAEGIVQAFAMLGDEARSKPIVVRLDGNNADAGRAILDGAGLDNVRRVDTMDGAAKLAAELAAR